MFMNADIVVKAVMVGLAFASLVTWTVWLAKTIETRRARPRAPSEAGQHARERAPAGRCRADRPRRQRRGRADHPVRGARGQPVRTASTDDGFKERIALRLERVEAAMSRRIARGTGVLATIGATAPFVGLFGTVWGIMNAFIGISEAQDHQPRGGRARHRRSAAGDRARPGRGDPGGGDLQSPRRGRSRPIARCSATPRRR